jgi:hypothetical protein
VNKLTVTEKEWLIHEDIDELLKLNYRTQLQAREYVKRCYLKIRNNVHSIEPLPLTIRDRYDRTKEAEERTKGTEA